MTDFFFSRRGNGRRLASTAWWATGVTSLVSALNDAVLRTINKPVALLRGVVDDELCRRVTLSLLRAVIDCLPTGTTLNNDGPQHQPEAEVATTLSRSNSGVGRPFLCAADVAAKT